MSQNRIAYFQGREIGRNDSPQKSEKKAAALGRMLRNTAA